MKKALIRILSLLLVFSLCILSAPVSVFSFNPAIDEGLCYDCQLQEFMDDTEAGMQLYEQEKYDLPTLPNGDIPPRYKIIKGTKLYINYRLWKHQHILCYGNYKHVPGNDFKNSTQVSSNVTVKGKGYYKKDGKYGEYRYHGYDVNGNYLANFQFEPDIKGSRFDERDWIKDPWVNLPVNLRPSTISIYNRAAIEDRLYTDPSVKPGVQNWINKSLEQYGGVPLYGDAVDPEVYRYMYIESAPTTMGPGQGRMWHMGRVYRRPFYQTLSIPKIEAKQNVPVVAEIKPLTQLEVVDVGPSMDDMPVTLQFEVTAVLQDNDIIVDPVLMTVYYTRYDIDSWEFEFMPPSHFKNSEKQTVTGVKKVDNTGSYIFTVKTTYGELRSADWVIHLSATAQPRYRNNKTGHKANASLVYDISVSQVTKPASTPDAITIDLPNVSVNNSIGEIAFDGVPFADAKDYTNTSFFKSIEVFVNGVPVDYSLFFSGNYIFPEVTDINGYMAEVICRYNVDKSKISPAGLTDELKYLLDHYPIQYVTTDYVYVYPTKPIANFHITSNTWKENRLINVTNRSYECNIQLVVDRFPIIQYEWSFGGDVSQLRKGIDTDNTKQLLYKKPGTYSLTLRCKNTLGKWSDPYTVEFEVLEDIGPAIGLNLSTSVYTRNDTVEAWHYEAVSNDGDMIGHSKIELWYDSDNDGETDLLLNTWNDVSEFPTYTPSKLGYYKYVVYAKEDFNTDTLLQYITDDDKKSSTYEVDFWVDNYRPLSDLYVNIPIQRPNVDVYFMLDLNLDTEIKDYMLANRVNIANWLLGKNIIPNVNIWDMRTYTYSQDVSVSRYSGSNYPPSTIYYESNGYSGTLTRYSVSNNRYQKDEGKWETRVETKTATTTATGYAISYYRRGKYGGWVLIDSTGTDQPTQYYSDSDGFSGTLYKTDYVLTSDNGPPPDTPGPEGETYTRQRTYLAYYSGTVSRTVQVYVPNYVWYDDYTGYYSGTIYKDVRQPYTDVFSPTAEKYVIYISNNTISELDDLNMVMSYAENAKLFVVGSDAIKTQRPYDKYYSIEGKAINLVIDEILQDIAENSPAVERYYVLQNEGFTMNIGHIDLEDDSIIVSEIQYVHDYEYYDNPTGIEPGAITEYSETTGWLPVTATSSLNLSFSNVGKFTLYYRVKDWPSTDPRFSEYSYYSGPTYVEIYVVRKPIASAILDWDYDPSGGRYKTVWVDLSYDPDHQYSREDKGIVNRSIKWRMIGGQWHYGIPDYLVPGSYELYYYVQDPEGYWSDPFYMNFTLNQTPPIQFNASLRALESKFSLLSIPASEYLEAFDLWTRYPTNPTLSYALYQNNSPVTTVKYINFDGSNGFKTGNDIYWNNFVEQIPLRSDLRDGLYEFRITASSGGQTAIKRFDVNVVTPINLNPIYPKSDATPPSTLLGKRANIISANTSKYTNSCTVRLFVGTSYQTSYFTMNGVQSGDIINWVYNYTPPASIPVGIYNAEFRATTINGNVETKIVPFELKHNTPPTVTIIGTDPGVIYEKERADVLLRVADEDLDELSISLTLLRNGTTVLNDRFNVSPGAGGAYDIIRRRISNYDITPGNYVLNVDVTDAYGESSSDSYSFVVYDLYITGSVSHTELWDKHRQRYNAAKPDAYRNANVFFPGEKFILDANTTPIHSSRPDLKPISVTCHIEGESISPAVLSMTAATKWHGVLWDESMYYWKDRTLDFVFTVTYESNYGTIVKTHVVTPRIEIVDDKYWRLHMLF